MLKALRKTRNKINKFFNSFINLKDNFYLKKLQNGDYKVTDSLKYYSQFASPELVKDILEKRISAKDDPRWQEFGFSKPEEYEFWSWRACGIICIKMIIDTAWDKNEKIKDLIEEGIKLGGYVSHDKNGNLIDKGWYYKPLINLAKKYNFTGKVFPHLSIQNICREILKKHFVVVSVDPGLIRYDEVKSDFKGGHVVLVYGFKWENKKCMGFYLHNPSGKSEETRKAFIPTDVFKKAFAGRGFSIWKK